MYISVGFGGFSVSIYRDAMLRGAWSWFRDDEVGVASLAVGRFCFDLAWPVRALTGAAA